VPGHFVYIVRCVDGSLYTGYARDPKARVIVHNSGRGARYTASRRPVRLVYSEKCPTLSAALKREYELKQWPRAKKQALTRRKRDVRRTRGEART
jgi:predicted GIY-YIG superfamily endonuclease